MLSCNFLDIFSKNQNCKFKNSKRFNKLQVVSTLLMKICHKKQENLPRNQRPLTPVRPALTAVGAGLIRRARTKALKTAPTEFFSLPDGRQEKTAGAARMVIGTNNAVTHPRSGDTFLPATVRRPEFQLSAKVERSGRLMPLLGCGHTGYDRISMWVYSFLTV